MALEIFDWPVDVGSGVDFNWQTNRIELGDGYSTIVGIGINTEKQVWNVSMFVDRRDPNSPGNLALAFLRRHKGYKSFQWQTPHGETIKVKCTKLNDSSNGATTYNMSATFEQFFTPE